MVALLLLRQSSSACNKSSKGARTLDDVLRDAMVTGDLSEVVRHIRKTIDRFSADRSDRVFCDAGGQLGRLWSRALALNDGVKS